MRVEPHANLTITLINRNQYGSLRFRGSGVVDPPAIPRGLAYQLRTARLTGLRLCPPPKPPCDPLAERWKPIYWPYDQPACGWWMLPPQHATAAAIAARPDPCSSQSQRFLTLLPDDGVGPVKGRLLDVLA